ncbi:MAG: hypothetical protein R3258_00395 [Acidimicrobiia bacterium]|nr:hypothetical protein [Acidimicrobiia bacterium]
MPDHSSTTGAMFAREQELRAMSDQELSAEWVRAMTVEIDPDNRTAQLATIDEVVAEINARSERAPSTSLIITPDDALAVSEYLKSTITAGGTGWYEEEPA